MSKSNRNVWLKMIVMFSLASVLLFLSVSTSAKGAWYDPAWGYRQEVTVTSLGNFSDLSNFPVLVELTAQGNPLFSNAQSIGGDILFTDAGGNKLNHEIEYYDTGFGTKKLNAWVQVPTLPAAGTSLYMYYGNSGAANQENVIGTWDSNYKMVQHFQETLGPVYDSTSNNNDGTLFGPSFTAAGKIDGAYSFNSSEQDYIDIGQRASLNDISDAITLEAWVKTPFVSGKAARMIDNWGDSPYKGYALAITGTSTNPNNIARVILSQTDGGFAMVDSNAHITTGEWLYIAGALDGATGTLTLYLNGVAHNSTTGVGPITAADGNLVLGSVSYGTEFYLDGILDEVRISDTGRSADWIKASYNNQKANGAYGEFGDQQIVPEPSTLVMMLAAGLLGLLCYAWRKRK